MTIEKAVVMTSVMPDPNIKKFQKEIMILKKEIESLKQEINRTTDFEKEIAQLKAKSEEWSLFRGFAIRHRKGKRSEEYQIPTMLCPQCCRPTEEIWDKESVLLTYRPVQSESIYGGYQLVHPNEYDPNISQKSCELPISLWNQCKKIGHDEWHIDYMRRTDDDYEVMSDFELDDIDIEAGEIILTEMEEKAAKKILTLDERFHTRDARGECKGLCSRQLVGTTLKKLRGLEKIKKLKRGYYQILDK